MSLISTLAIPKYHILFIVHHIYIYIYINTAVSCKRYPPSLPYIIIVQTCGKRWDLPKFVNVLSVNLRFSQSLIYLSKSGTGSCVVSENLLLSNVEKETCQIRWENNLFVSVYHIQDWPWKTVDKEFKPQTIMVCGLNSLPTVFQMIWFQVSTIP